MCSYLCSAACPHIYVPGFELNFVQTGGVTVGLGITEPSAGSAGSHSNLLPTATRHDPLGSWAGVFNGQPLSTGFTSEDKEEPGTGLEIVRN